MAGISHNPLQSFAVASGAVSKPDCDAAGQGALHSAGVECSEDAGAHSKLPQPSQEEEALMCLTCLLLILYYIILLVTQKKQLDLTSLFNLKLRTV